VVDRQDDQDGSGEWLNNSVVERQDVQEYASGEHFRSIYHEKGKHMLQGI
jgi:hypothetical protein